jgi:hypothetical protein
MAQKKQTQNLKKASPNRTQELPRTGGSSRGKDIVQIVLIGVVCAAIFTGIGIALAMSRGLSFGQGGAIQAATEIALNGTPIPTIAPTATPTEIPCEAQVWWDGISAATAAVVDNILALSVELPPQQVTSGRDALNAWKTSLESQTALSPCVQEAHQALLVAAAEAQTLYGLYLSPTTLQQRVQQVLRVMDIYLPATDALNQLGLTVTEDWFTRVQTFTRAECPAKRWYIEQFIVRDYNRYFTLLDSINIQSMAAADLQTALVDLRTLSTSFKTDTPSFPACVQSPSARYSASIDALIRALNEALNGNLTAVDSHLVTVSSEKTAFQTELTALDPSLFDPNTPDL